MRCVQIEQLLDFTQDRAEPVERDLIQAHLASGCTRCQGNLAWIQKIVWLTATDDSVEPPKWVLDRAVRLFQIYGPQRKPGLLQRITASLVFDSLTQPQLVGVRQTGQAARQSLYRAGEWDVDLSFEPGEGPETIDIAGQVLKGEGQIGEVAGIPVHLIQGEEILASTVADQLGEFTFDCVASGTYSLRIDLRDQSLWIGHMDVKLSE
ncbi:MAG: hypothetical protein HY314_01795 [Acidobacteria bacterium]|nr:hypothetical protein [Acidobacteriota bacterium]